MDLEFLRRVVRNAYEQILELGVPDHERTARILGILHEDISVELMDGLLLERKAQVALEASRAFLRAAELNHGHLNHFHDVHQLRLVESDQSYDHPLDVVEHHDELDALANTVPGDVALQYIKIDNVPLVDRAPPPTLGEQLDIEFPDIGIIDRLDYNFADVVDGQWTRQQHDVFIRVVQAHDTDFEAIANHLPEKKLSDVKNYFARLSGRRVFAHLVNTVQRIQ